MKLVCISIHAPTQGATIMRHTSYSQTLISIHAPTQGATGSSSTGLSSGSNFNPRTHAGCDGGVQTSQAISSLFQSTHPRRVRLWSKYISFISSLISIHAPTQGATACGRCRVLVYFYFNPRTHAGCDIVIIKIRKAVFNFNPRTHAGCDNHLIQRMSRQQLFQSTHPRRVRRRACGRSIWISSISIHAPTQGATS